MVKTTGKGRRLELKFAKLLRKVDPKARRRPYSGSEKLVKGYGDIYTKLPFAFEVKNQERLRIWDWWDQTKQQARYGTTPVLVFSSNHRPVMVALEADDFIHILKEVYENRD